MVLSTFSTLAKHFLDVNVPMNKPFLLPLRPNKLKTKSIQDRERCRVHCAGI